MGKRSKSKSPKASAKKAELPLFPRTLESLSPGELLCFLKWVGEPVEEMFAETFRTQGLCVAFRLVVARAATIHWAAVTTALCRV